MNIINNIIFIQKEEFDKKIQNDIRISIIQY